MKPSKTKEKETYGRQQPGPWGKPNCNSTDKKRNQVHTSYKMGGIIGKVRMVRGRKGQADSTH